MIDINLFKNCVSIDVETTGIDPVKNALVSIGATAFHTDDAFYVECFVPDDKEISEEALKVNGENEADLRSRKVRNFVSPDDAVRQLLGWLKERGLTVIIGKNPQFDRGFLRRTWIDGGWDEAEFDAQLSYRCPDWSDMLIPLWAFMGREIPPFGLSTMSVLTFLGLKHEPVPHNALNGALYNKQCLLAILKRYSSASE